MAKMKILKGAEVSARIKEHVKEMLEQLNAIMDPAYPKMSNLANAAALLYEKMELVNWAGFYLCEGDSLWLGPFGGKTACVRIRYGKGVCGTAWAVAQTQLVKDVHEFPGHIACDSASASEIVVPLFKEGDVIGVLDIDSPVKGRFTLTDKEGLEAVGRLIEAML